MIEKCFFKRNNTELLELFSKNSKRNKIFPLVLALTLEYLLRGCSENKNFKQRLNFSNFSCTLHYLMKIISIVKVAQTFLLHFVLYKRFW
jgi:hypothetical protein